VHVVIVGCGRVGSSLAHSLVAVDHTVAVIDRNAEAFRRLGENFAGQIINGIGFDRDQLKLAGIERADAVAAVTSGDNSNILIARVARETFGIERVVARIYDPKRATIYQRLGISTVASVSWTSERVLRRLLPDEPAVEWVDPSAKLMLVERSVGASWAGSKLSVLEQSGLCRAAAVSRLGVSSLPSADLVLQQGDLLYLSVLGDAVNALDAHLAGPQAGGSH
jgi:trk system potassium uptake protein